MSKTPKGTAVITGASAGIGAIYADRLARRGHDLLIVARSTTRLETLAITLGAETGRKIEVLTADLTDRADIAKLEDRLATDPSISVLVNNAGMSLNGGILENSAAKIETLIALNIAAPTLLAAAAAKAFAARKHGAIINIASVLAVAPEMFDGIYAGSKAHLLNLSHSLAGQLADKNVRVQAVLPGATRTEIWERSGNSIDDLPAEMVMEVDDLVDAALVGFDRGETVTIPPLQDEKLWQTYEQARLALAPHLSRNQPAPRYRQTANA